MISAASEQTLGVNFDTLDFRPYLGLVYATGESGKITLSPVDLPGHTLTLVGSFIFNDADQLTYGRVTGITLDTPTGHLAISELRDPSGFPGLNAIQLFQNATSMAPDVFLETLLSGGLNVIEASAYSDLIRGYDGINYIFGYEGADSIFGGPLSDLVWGAEGQDYLRGGAGQDTLRGGDDFDDINGNTGDDTLDGQMGDDWVVGGKDNDLLNGGAGADIVYGNLGDDRCYGDAGNDIVRGGKDNDTIDGGDGDDWLSGDKGTDVITGGAGADIFHTFVGAGQDRVTDFNRAEGDRIQLLPGETYTATQVGADTLIDVGGGEGLLLVGVSAATVSADWFV